MSWNGGGTFNRLYSWVADKAAGLNISSSRMDADTNDITSNGFGNCLTRDGQGQATANLPMANFRHTGVGNAQARTDYAAAGQLQDGLVFWTTSGGSADAITATYTPAITALSDGQLCCFRASLGNLTATPTFAPNGLTARTITKFGGIALSPGDISGNLAEVMLRYNSANTRWELLNPPAVPIGSPVPYFGGTVPAGYALPLGQNLSAATYPVANAVLSTTYGSPGGGNFTMPDGRGRSYFQLDQGGSGRITVAGGNYDGASLGNHGGGQNQSIQQANLPAVPPTGSINSTSNVIDPDHQHDLNVFSTFGGPNFGPSGTTTGTSTSTYSNGARSGPTNVGVTTSSTFTGSNLGSGTALSILPPSMVINWMMRIA